MPLTDFVHPRPQELTGLVAYQEGSVVSREVLRTPSGSLTVFAFAAGQGLSEHTAPFDATVLVLDGLARITVGGAAHQVKAGELLVMPAGIPHALEAPERFKMLLIMLRG